MSVRAGLPWVRVPVLSKTTVVTASAVWSAAPLLTSTPSWAPRPVPTMIEVGTARPMAQGQAMTMTAMKMRREKSRLAPPSTYQPRNESTAAAMTAGTK